MTLQRSSTCQSRAPSQRQIEEPPLLLNSPEQSPKCHCSLDNVVTGPLQITQNLWAQGDTVICAENPVNDLSSPTGGSTARPQGTSEAFSVSLSAVPAGFAAKNNPIKCFPAADLEKGEKLSPLLMLF